MRGLGSGIKEFKQATKEDEDKKDKKTIVFSGDFGNLNKPILRDPVQVDKADFVVVESAYGDRKHESVKSKRLVLGKIFLENVKKNIQVSTQIY